MSSLTVIVGFAAMGFIVFLALACYACWLVARNAILRAERDILERRLSELGQK